MNLADLRAAFASREKLTQDLTAAQGQIAQLTEELEAARAEATQQRERADGLQAQIDEAQQTIDQLTGRVSTLEGEAQTVEQAASRQMQETMAQIGVPAAELPAAVEVTAETPEELRKQYQAIKDPSERAQFWAKHSSRMMA